ncbi:MAG TPA: hypothetical protein VFS25_23480 [Chitinophaga sp.]|uniref:hypothetical protein n=1 Tax=Chitinophaga sp. TaxID=1869181 RepID=UPI002DB70837|nr:hypothetical protein [Chitinophaga sp.]HEU4555826.1 hypothetical protein [Chitinophaga sp.]
MYDVKPNLIIGFHGCDADVCKALLNNPDQIKISKRPYDWLGHGMYFWENNYDRAFQWAYDKQQRGAIKKPAVIGGLLQPGYCCDFTETKYIAMLSSYHNVMARRYKLSGEKLPENKDLPHDKYKDRILRELDCATIEFMHMRIFKRARLDILQKGFTKEKPFDSTRGVFTEGGPAFEGAGLFAKSHIQLCIRNPNCIKGFFLPRREIDFRPPPTLTYS